MPKKKLLFAFGTRPEAIKMAPLIKSFAFHKKEFTAKVCITAQHRQMLDDVLGVFRIKPDYDLNIMQEGQTLFHVTCNVLNRVREVLLKEKPDLVFVHGDTTTTFAVSLASFYMKIPVAHVEAGLRSYNKYHPFPEELNRVLTDSLCDMYFAPTAQARRSLELENKPGENIFVTGNTVIDALRWVLACKFPLKEPYIKTLRAIKEKDPDARFVLVRAQRRENFGKPLESIFKALKRIAVKYPSVHIVYPVHLNPQVRVPAERILGNIRNFHLLKPLVYPDMAKLMEMSYMVVTDSGGLQEEAPSLGKPVLVLREVTERPEAVKAGTVKIVGTIGERIFREISRLLDDKKAYAGMAFSVNPYGDGKASARIIQAVRHHFGFAGSKPREFGAGRVEPRRLPAGRQARRRAK